MARAASFDTNPGKLTELLEHRSQYLICLVKNVRVGHELRITRGLWLDVGEVCECWIGPANALCPGPKNLRSPTNTCTAISGHQCWSRTSESSILLPVRGTAQTFSHARPLTSAAWISTIPPFVMPRLDTRSPTCSS